MKRWVNELTYFINNLLLHKLLLGTLVRREIYYKTLFKEHLKPTNLSMYLFFIKIYYYFVTWWKYFVSKIEK